MNSQLLPRISHGVRRIGEVVGVLAKYGLADWLSGTELERSKRFFVGKDGAVLAKESHAARIRLAALELGTTYIKLGQMLSTRPDLVGQDVAAELARLQDGVPADPPELTLAAVTTELRRPPSEIFSEFGVTPIGSASIGQVHLARLPEGQAVVVKVQHPGIESRIREDLVIMKRIAGLLERSAELKRYQPVAVVREFQRSIGRELDFGREERNLEQFAANFAGDPTVYFPCTYTELSTSRVLTMEYIEGVSLHESDRLDQIGVSREELARRGATIWLEMVFRDGFFHADPHPGNLRILPGGVIGIFDCGMVGRIDDGLRETIEDGLIAISNRDGSQLARLIMHLCSAPPDLDESAFSSDVVDYVAYYGNQPMDRLQLGGALNEITRILSSYQLVLPPGVASLIKTFAMLEGAARLLCPTTNVLGLIKSYQRKIRRRRLSPQAQWRKWQRTLGHWRHLGETLPREIGAMFEKIQKGTFDVHLEHRRLEFFVNRLAMGLIASALFLGSAILWSNRVPPVLGGYSVAGVLGCALSIILGGRLVRKIWRE